MRHHRPSSLSVRTLLAMAATVTVLLSACGSSPNGIPGMDYHPRIIHKDVDPAIYEKDRSQCERMAREKTSNYEATTVINFRRCLIDRGYKLMS